MHNVFWNDIMKQSEIYYLTTAAYDIVNFRESGASFSSLFKRKKKRESYMKSAKYHALLCADGTFTQYFIWERNRRIQH